MVLGGIGSQFAVILAAILLVVSRELMRDFKRRQHVNVVV